MRKFLSILDVYKRQWLGCVVAATIIALPLMYRNARAAFEQIDENVIYAARTLGISEWKIFWKIRLPMAKPGIISGVTLALSLIHI